jgi:hypothetical protein
VPPDRREGRVPRVETRAARCGSSFGAQLGLEVERVAAGLEEVIDDTEDQIARPPIELYVPDAAATEPHLLGILRSAPDDDGLAVVDPRRSGRKVEVGPQLSADLRWRGLFEGYAADREVSADLLGQAAQIGRGDLGPNRRSRSGPIRRVESGMVSARVPEDGP